MNVMVDALSRVEVQLDPTTILVTLAGAVIRPDEHIEVDNIDDSKTLNKDVEEKIMLAKAVNNGDCKWASV